MSRSMGEAALVCQETNGHIMLGAEARAGRGRHWTIQYAANEKARNISAATAADTMNPNTMVERQERQANQKATFPEALCPMPA